MKKLIILATTCFFCLCIVRARGQATGEQPFTFNNNGAAAASRVYKDSRIDLLIQKQVYINTLALRHVPGYRVQVISTMDRGKAMQAKARLMQLFPSYQAYLSYQSPYFRVRIGDFRDRSAAEDLQKELNDYFPNGVFTVSDYIHISPEQLFQTRNDDSDN